MNVKFKKPGIESKLMEEYYIGKEIERIFNEVLRAKQALIVSPWIGSPYAEKLLELVKQGRARVVTSMSNDSQLYKLVHRASRGAGKRIIRKSLLIPGVLLFFMGLILAAAHLIAITFFTILISLILIALSSKKVGKPEWLANIRFSPPSGQDGFIHIKLYIADDKAWIGSANMTITAHKHNIEVLIPIPIELAKSIFEDAWKSAKSL